MEVYVRARTADNRVASVNALDLTEESFKRFILRHMVDNGILAGLQGESKELYTHLTKDEVEHGQGFGD
jgi:hypothetical protein